MYHVSLPTVKYKTTVLGEIDMTTTASALIVTEPKSSMTVVVDAAKEHATAQGYASWELGPRLITDRDTLQRVNQLTAGRADLKDLASQWIHCLIERKGGKQSPRGFRGWGADKYLATLPGASVITVVNFHGRGLIG